MKRPNIAILSLGGTIAGVRGDNGVIPALGAEAIAATLSIAGWIVSTVCWCVQVRRSPFTTN